MVESENGFNVIHTGETSDSDSNTDESAISAISFPKYQTRINFGCTKTVDDDLLCRSLNHVSVVDVKCCTCTAKQKWAVCRANLPAQERSCLGCDHADKGWNLT